MLARGLRQSRASARCCRHTNELQTGLMALNVLSENHHFAQVQAQAAGWQTLAQHGAGEAHAAAALTGEWGPTARLLGLRAEAQPAGPSSLGQPSRPAEAAAPHLDAAAARVRAGSAPDPSAAAAPALLLPGQLLGAPDSEQPQGTVAPRGRRTYPRDLWMQLARRVMQAIKALPDFSGDGQHAHLLSQMCGYLNPQQGQPGRCQLCAASEGADVSALAAGDCQDVREALQWPAHLPCVDLAHITPTKQQCIGLCNWGVTRGFITQAEYDTTARAAQRR